MRDEQEERVIMFKVGDAIIHPVRGAGVVIGIERRPWRGRTDRYYTIRLLAEEGTTLMVPVDTAETLGLRRAVTESKLKRVWRVLRADPQRLPVDHKKRYQFLKEKLQSGDIIDVTEVVRDMAWRQQEEGRLTTVGKRLYDKGITLLAGEIAAVQSTEVENAEMEIRERLQELLSPTAAVAKLM
jgi:CarD family transcriptional regulator